MEKVYYVLVAIHLIAIAVTGILWAIIDVVPKTSLREHFQEIRAVHFGSLYLVPILLGLAFAFWRLQVPDVHQVVFPAGLFLLLLFSSIGYLFPRPAGLDSFYYWTKGPALVLAVIGIVCLVVALLWTAAVLVWFAIVGPAGS